MSGQTKFGKRSNCKVCSSPRRLEADKRLINGETARKVAVWLTKTGEPVTEAAVGNHKKKHLAVTTKAREQLDAAKAEARARMDATQAEADAQVATAVEKVLADVELLDVLATTHMGIIRQMTKDSRRPDAGSDSMPSVVLFNACAKEVRECVKTKHEILEGKKVNLDGLDGLAGILGAALDDEEIGAGEEAPPPLEA